jgi:hypothetical protein
MSNTIRTRDLGAAPAHHSHKPTHFSAGCRTGSCGALSTAAEDAGAVTSRHDHRQAGQLWRGQTRGHARIEHRQHKGLNNRADNSHQPTRRRQRQMKQFKSAGQGSGTRISRPRHTLAHGFCLTLVPKNKAGQPLTSRVEALNDPREDTPYLLPPPGAVDKNSVATGAGNGAVREIKEWQAIMDHLRSLPAKRHGELPIIAIDDRAMEVRAIKTG